MCFTTPTTALNADHFLRRAHAILPNLSSLTVYLVHDQCHLDAITDWIAMPECRINYLHIDGWRNGAQHQSSLSLVRFVRYGLKRNESLRHLIIANFDFSNNDCVEGVASLADTLRGIESLELYCKLPASCSTSRMFCDIVRNSRTLTSLYASALVDDPVMSYEFSHAVLHNITLQKLVVLPRNHDFYAIGERAMIRNRTVLQWNNVEKMLLEFCVGMAEVYSTAFASLQCSFAQFPPYVLLEVFDWFPSTCCCISRSSESNDQHVCPMQQLSVMHLLSAAKKIRCILRAQRAISVVKRY